MTTNKKTNVLYWIFTGIFLFFMIGSSIPDIMVMQMAVDGFAEIGLPAHLVPFLGWAKMLGAIALLLPGFLRIKEWAYAGLIIDLCGAIYLVACVKPAAENWIPMFIPLVFGFLSYAWHHKRLEQKQLSENPTG